MKPRVFVGSTVENLEITYAIQQNLEYDATVVLWNQIERGSFSFLDALEKETKEVDFAVFVFVPDDLVKVRGINYPTVRDNLIFELGLFLSSLGNQKGSLGKDRCFVLVPRGKDKSHLPSDLNGLDPLTYPTPIRKSVTRAVLGPACEIIRARIKSLGRFKSTRKQTITFFKDRNALPPLEKQLQGTNELWLSFFTGSVINAAELYTTLFEKKRVKLLLPDPFYSAFNDLTKLWKQPLRRMRDDVCALTASALRDRVQVRWYRGPMVNGLIIGNPNLRGRSWARLELLMPFRNTHDRPSIRVQAGLERKVFSEIKNSFNDMWKMSKVPPKTKLKY